MVMQTQVPHGWGAAAQRQRRDKELPGQRTRPAAEQATVVGALQQRSGLRPLVSEISHKALSLVSSSESTERDRRPNRSRARCGNGLDVRGGT